MVQREYKKFKKWCYFRANAGITKINCPERVICVNSREINGTWVIMTLFVKVTTSTELILTVLKTAERLVKLKKKIDDARQVFLPIRLPSKKNNICSWLSEQVFLSSTDSVVPRKTSIGRSSASAAASAPDDEHVCRAAKTSSLGKAALHTQPRANGVKWK